MAIKHRATGIHRFRGEKKGATWLGWLIRWSGRQTWREVGKHNSGRRVYDEGEIVAQWVSGHKHNFYWLFFGLFFFLPLCFWFIDVVWQPCRVAGAKRDQLDIRPEQTPQKRNLTGEAVGGKVCVCARTTVLFICIYSVLMSAHTQAPEPRVRNLDFYVCMFCVFVCIELVEECTFDWVQIAYKSGF